MRYAIGIDLGTTAVKAILLNEEGGIVHSASRSYPLYNPQNGWAEQDPCDWKRAVFEVLSEIGSLGHVEKEDIKGIGFSGQMHGLVLLDGKGNPLGRSIIWCDQRSGQEAEDMKGIMPEEEWIRITGNPPIAAWTAACSTRRARQPSSCSTKISTSSGRASPSPPTARAPSSTENRNRKRVDKMLKPARYTCP